MLLKTMFVLPALGLALAGCASGLKKADIPANANPSEEITRIENDINRAHAAHADILADRDLKKSKSYLKEAKEDLADGDDQEDVLESVAYSRAYLDEALNKAEARQAKIETVIDARQRAVEAGATNFSPTLVQMREMDALVRDRADELDKADAEFVTKMQRSYLDIELNAIRHAQLGQAAANIEAAKKARASRYVPAALKRAEVDYKNAENLIAANRNQPGTYEKAVAKSVHSAGLLTAILQASKGGNIDEGTATRVVMQERQIANLEGELNQAGDEAAAMGQALASQGRNLEQAGAAIKMQRSLANAQKEFSPAEAEVFQQGEKLVIRLKSMNFATGRSDVPPQALPILAKVQGVAQELNATELKVEGHTDSTGSARVNRDLSESRAESIAKYFETNGMSEEQIDSIGYGFERPIASNKSKAGRAQNRRVDIVITPGQMAEGTQAKPTSETE